MPNIVHGEAPVYYEDEGVQLIHGDALDVMVQQARAGLQVDAVVTDPPYSSGGAMRSDKMRDVVDKYASSGVARDYTTSIGDSCQPCRTPYSQPGGSGKA